MVLGLVIAGAFLCGIGALLWVATKRPPPPDDTHAVRLAAELEGTPPQLRGDLHWWRFTCVLGVTFELSVDAEGSVCLRRALSAPVEHPSTLLAEPLLGRAQEDYRQGRWLVPTDRGLEVVGHPNELHGWEKAIDPTLVDALKRLRLGSVSIGPDAIRACPSGASDAERVREVAAFLRELERRVTGAGEARE